MFFRRKEVCFNIKDEYVICSLYDTKQLKFYSLVLQKDRQQFFNSLCFAYEKSADNELLKLNKDNLEIYMLGFFNASNGQINSNVKYIGSFKKLIEDYDKKKFKGGIFENGSEDKDNKDSI